MTSNLTDRKIAFTFEDGHLVRTVTGAGGKTYTHRCSLKAYEAAAFALEETPVDGEGVTVKAIAEREGVPFTQADLAVAFLYDRGIVDRRHRRNYPVGNGTYLDSMIEWFALAERNHEAGNTMKGA